MAAFLMAAVCVPAGAQVSLTTIVTLAQKNSAEVRSADAQLARAQAVATEAHDVYIPSVIAASTLGPPAIGFPTGQPSIASMSVQSLVYSAAQHQYGKSARAGVQAASLSLKDAKEQVALDASTAYLELDAVTREQAQAADLKAESDRLVDIERQRAEAGVDSADELLEARLTSAEVQLKQIHLESRAAVLVKQLAGLTGLPEASIVTDHASIPEIPAVTGLAPAKTAGIQAAEATATSKQLQALGDAKVNLHPEIAFGGQYNRDAVSLDNYNVYFGNKFKADNFSAGVQIQIPLFDAGHKAKARETGAEALRAKVDAEQAERQNELAIAQLSGSIRELSAVEEIAALKQQIADAELASAQSETQNGNGSATAAQATPKTVQLALIDASQKKQEAVDAGFDLAKARLSLLRALGHMDDWLREVNSNRGVPRS